MDPIDELLDTMEMEGREIRDAIAQYRRSERSRKGGLSVSQDRQHMVEIGRKGGQKVSADRTHMSEIGRRGGARARVAKESNDGPSQDPGAPGEGEGSGS